MHTFSPRRLIYTMALVLLLLAPALAQTEWPSHFPANEYGSEIAIVYLQCQLNTRFTLENGSYCAYVATFPQGISNLSRESSRTFGVTGITISRNVDYPGFKHDDSFPYHAVPLILGTDTMSNSFRITRVVEYDAKTSGMALYNGAGTDGFFPASAQTFFVATLDWLETDPERNPRLERKHFMTVAVCKDRDALLSFLNDQPPIGLGVPHLI